MFKSKLLNWLFSITLLISLISFTGIVHEQVKPVHTTTNVVAHKNTPTSAYRVNVVKQYIAPESTTYYGLDFKAFIQMQNLFYCQKEKAQSLVVLTFKDVFNTTHSNLVSATNTDGSFTFIG